MQHEEYMDIKFLLGMWEGDIGRGKELSSNEKWWLRSMFRKMNRRQRWDTIDGNNHITKILIEQGLVTHSIKNGYKYDYDLISKENSTHEEKKNLFKRILGKTLGREL
jgi:hypothetical protein